MVFYIQCYYLIHSSKEGLYFFQNGSFKQCFNQLSLIVCYQKIFCFLEFCEVWAMYTVLNLCETLRHSRLVLV